MKKVTRRKYSETGRKQKSRSARRPKRRRSHTRRGQINNNVESVYGWYVNRSEVIRG